MIVPNRLALPATPPMANKDTGACPEMPKVARCLFVDLWGLLTIPGWVVKEAHGVWG
jgi:hypothetical protein